MKCCVLSSFFGTLMEKDLGKFRQNFPNDFLSKLYALFIFFFLQLLTMRLVNMVLDKYEAYNPEPLSYSIKYAASNFLSI